MSIIYGELKDSNGNILRDKILYDDIEQNKKDIANNSSNIEQNTQNIEDIQIEVNNIQQYIKNAHTVSVKNTIAERDAIQSPKVGDLCWVIDATSDPTVDKGAAYYIWQDNNGWKKLAEVESMDVILSWEDIVGKKISTAIVEVNDSVPNNLEDTGIYFQKIRNN